jgi:hypothetical protein
MKTITFKLAADLLARELQDPIRLNLPVILGSYVHTVRGREIQDPVAIRSCCSLELPP